MNIFEKLFANTEIPELYPVKFSLPCGQIHREQIDGIIRKELQNGDLASRIKSGMSVAITAGSREITDIDQIVRTVVDFVRECKGEPFVFPAMAVTEVLLQKVSWKYSQDMASQKKLWLPHLFFHGDRAYFRYRKRPSRSY